MHSTLAQPDGGVETGEAAETNLKRRDRSPRPKGTVLFCK
jgi:hypothetical protein